MSSITFWGVLLATLLTAIGFHLHQDSLTQKRLDAALAKTVLCDQVNARNQNTITELTEINGANALEAERQRQKAEAAAERIAELEADSNEQIVIIRQEANTHRTGLDCAALTPEFRGWLHND